MSHTQGTQESSINLNELQTVYKKQYNEDMPEQISEMLSSLGEQNAVPSSYTYPGTLNITVQIIPSFGILSMKNRPGFANFIGTGPNMLPGSYSLPGTITTNDPVSLLLNASLFLLTFTAGSGTKIGFYDTLYNLLGSFTSSKPIPIGVYHGTGAFTLNQ